MSGDVPCDLCKEPSKYTCPRCGINYCCVRCYQKPDHLHCSEAFYQACVKEEIQSQDVNPEMKRKMLETLTRLQDEENEQDSDDDESLSDRLAGINLENSEAVWDRLTDCERQDFGNFLRGDQTQKIIPHYKPWWEHRKIKKLVVECDIKEEMPLKEEVNIPPLLQPIPLLSQVTTKPPADIVIFNLINVLFAYTYMSHYYYGDWHSFSAHFSLGVMLLSANLSKNHNFDSAEKALQAAKMELLNHSWLRVSPDMSDAASGDVQQLLAGPELDTPVEKISCVSSQFVLAALSDLHATFRHTIKSLQKDSTDSTGICPPSKKDLRLAMKKLEYLLSWTKEHGPLGRVSSASSPALTTNSQ